jgi:broad specificity phosphatase PhoE
MLELLFIRHGQTEWNSKRQVMGRKPIPLNEAGRAQAMAAASFLATASIDVILSSPVERAMETARIIATKQSGLAVEEAPAFIEIDYGDWVDCTFDELATRFPEEWKCYRTEMARASFSGGESIKDAAARIHAGVDGLLARPGVERAVVVSHADVLKIALVHVLGFKLETIQRFAIDNGTVLLVRFSRDGGPRLVMANTLMGFGKDLRISDTVPTTV